jgi:hypothetical protein
MDSARRIRLPPHDERGPGTAVGLAPEPFKLFTAGS